MLLLFLGVPLVFLCCCVVFFVCRNPKEAKKRTQDLIYYYYFLYYSFLFICNNNWNEWSTIQGVIAGVISKSDECEVRRRVEITRTITPRIVRHEVQLLINRIYNEFRN